jgi:hypothetical protein
MIDGGARDYLDLRIIRVCWRRGSAITYPALATGRP